ncbi:hypothetical protein EV183_005059 [Coemansia sp. RSA 2336]|nr:hypothetical protein EV183_005059 [Coemansia sp. RSA 2336]
MLALIREQCIKLLVSRATGSQVRRAHGWHEADQVIRRLDADAYTTLGVTEKSSMQEIKAQYYRICRQLHPDTQTAHQHAPPPTLSIKQTRWEAMSMHERQAAMREQFGRARDAYEILSSAQLRHKYDAIRQRGRRRADPWASERPAFTGTPKTREQIRNERLLVWGAFGFLGVVLVIANYQRLLSAEREMERAEREHLGASRTLQLARERALEKWCQVPPHCLGEYESRRLARDKGMQQGDFHVLWPDGTGLGLIALLDDQQLCGVVSRSRVIHDDALARVRPAAQQALLQDPIVAHYIN